MNRSWIGVALIASVAVNLWLGWRAVRQEPGSPPPPAGGRGVGGPYDLLDPVERDWLRRAGLPSPADSLRVDLMRRPELIPTEGVVGGVMAFRESAIWVLPGGHVWAMADDGHIETALLLRYEVGEAGEIAWRVVYEGERGASRLASRATSASTFRDAIDPSPRAPARTAAT
jgi:hypothetical protein